MNRRSDTMQVGTEVSLFLVTAAAIVGMHRLFDDGSFRAPLLQQAFLAHLTMALLRRARVRLLPAALAAFAIGAVVIVVTQYMSTAWGIFPSPDTLHAISHDMDSAWEVFRKQEAPATVVPGFIVATSIVIWVIAFVADWGAFRTGVSFEALLPPATLFLFASVLGAEGQRAIGAALFVLAAMLFLLLHRTWRQEDSASWAALHQQRGRWFLVSTGGVLAGVAVLTAGIVGPSLPGADADAILHWKDISEKHKPRVVLSPLVDIQGRLVDQRNIQVFQVQTSDNRGHYWRVTALDSFDGKVWRSTYDTAEADGELPESIPESTDTSTISQEFTIQALSQIWLPAAYAPKSIDVQGGTTVKFDKASSTLIVPRALQSSDGMKYTVTSDVPDYTAEELMAASNEVPKAIKDRYTALPDGFSQRVRDYTTSITADKPTRWEKVMAIQDFLQTFEYTTDVPRGHGENALERFLFDEQRGYCEQFAASAAAMARSLGIPARVAVGFTEGERDKFNKGLFTVRGRNAHAWPEVWLAGRGWIKFEPTPQRGPSDADYLGLDPEQDNGDNTNAGPQPGGPDDPNAPTTTVAGGGPNNAPPPRDPEFGTNGVKVDDDGGSEGPFHISTPDLKQAAKPAGIGAAAYLLLVPLALVAQRLLRRSRARGPGPKVTLAWVEANESALAAGVKLPPSLTVAERAARMRTAMPDAAGAIEQVARSVERVTYAEVSPTADEVERVGEATATILATANQRRTFWSRLGSWLDIRRLLPQRESARRTAHGAERTPYPRLST